MLIFTGRNEVFGLAHHRDHSQGGAAALGHRSGYYVKAWEVPVYIIVIGRTRFQCHSAARQFQYHSVKKGLNY